MQTMMMLIVIFAQAQIASLRSDLLKAYEEFETNLSEMRGQGVYRSKEYNKLESAYFDLEELLFPN